MHIHARAMWNRMWWTTVSWLQADSSNSSFECHFERNLRACSAQDSSRAASSIALAPPDRSGHVQRSWQHQGRPEPPFRALWRHQGKPAERPFRALWRHRKAQTAISSALVAPGQAWAAISNAAGCSGGTGGKLEQLVAALWQHWVMPERVLRAPSCSGAAHTSIFDTQNKRKPHRCPWDLRRPPRFFEDRYILAFVCS